MHLYELSANQRAAEGDAVCEIAICGMDVKKLYFRCSNPRGVRLGGKKEEAKPLFFCICEEKEALKSCQNKRRFSPAKSAHLGLSRRGKERESRNPPTHERDLTTYIPTRYIYKKEPIIIQTEQAVACLLSTPFSSPFLGCN